MQVDVGQAIGAVTREVKAGERDGKPTRTIVATRTYPTNVPDLWDALTSEERIPRWFAPISGDLKQGGHYQLLGSAGGSIMACEPPRHLALTWEFNGEMSWVTIALAQVTEDETLLTLEHMVPLTAHYTKYGPGAVGVGWELGLTALDLHLSARSAISPPEVERWSLSDEGKAFAGASSNGWREAAIQGGEDPEPAAAAAERTRAFYGGETAAGG